MRLKIIIGSCVVFASLVNFGCEKTEAPTTTNANMEATNTATTTTTTSTTATANTEQPSAEQARPAPDESEITTTRESGVTTETRTFKNGNSRVEKVVVTTREGKRTARVYPRTGEPRDLPESKVESALTTTGNAISDGAGYVADKTKDAASATKEGAGKVINKTGDTAKIVGEKTYEGGKTVVEKTGDTAKTVGKKTGEGAKVVGEKTVEGAKKTGRAIKNAVTP